MKKESLFYEEVAVLFTNSFVSCYWEFKEKELASAEECDWIVTSVIFQTAAKWDCDSKASPKHLSINPPYSYLLRS